MNACGTTMNSASIVSLGVIGLEERSLVGQSHGRSLWNHCVKQRRIRNTATVSDKGFGKFRGRARLNLICAFPCGGGLQQQQQQVRKTLGRAERLAESAWDASSARHTLRLDCVAELRNFKTNRITRVRCNVGVAPVEEPKSNAEDHMHEQQHSSISGVRLGEKFSDFPVHVVSHVPEEVVSQVGGKAGLISFYPQRSDSSMEEEQSVYTSSSKSDFRSIIWPLGPFILVASVVLPPLYLRKIFGAVLEDSLVTDFVILFFTETLFFIGAAVFLYVAHISRLATAAAVAQSTFGQNPTVSPVYSLGYGLSAKVVLAVGVLLPVATFVIVWPWTGPAAAAALAPYMVGLFVQLGFEQIVHARRSPVWPLIPVTFQMYRLHQLNRAAQLVAGLLFSLKGVEATAETMAINGSLQTLLFLLQVLGMLCLWSLGSFLTNQLPSKGAQVSIPSMP